MDILPLLNEVQTLARNGLTYTTNPYDCERYQRLLALTSQYYGAVVNLPAPEVQQRLAAELGYITPKVGVDAAIFHGDGQILLMQRVDDGCWCLPCGWVEPNESPPEAVVRETREETGLEICPAALVDVFTRLPSLSYGPHTVISVVYYCTVVGGTMRLSHEGLALRYWPISDVSKWHKDHHRLAVAAYAVWCARRPPGYTASVARSHDEKDSSDDPGHHRSLHENRL